MTQSLKNYFAVSEEVTSLWEQPAGAEVCGGKLCFLCPVKTVRKFSCPVSMTE